MKFIKLVLEFHSPASSLRECLNFCSNLDSEKIIEKGD